MTENIKLSHEGQKVQHHIPVLERGHLSRRLGVFDLYAVGYGDVGSSIYYALGVTVLYSMSAAPIAMAIAGLFFICTVLTYAELSATVPEAGGSANFARFAFNDLVSFISGWALLLSYIMTLAISAYTIGPYLSTFFPFLKGTLFGVPVNVWFTIGIIFSLCILNIFGIKESTRVSMFLTIIDLVLEISIVLFGIFLLFNLDTVLSHINFGVNPTWKQFIYGITIAMVAFTGIEAVSQLSGETKNPEKKVPKAMILVMVTVVILSVLLSFIAVSALPPEIIVRDYLEDPLKGIAQAFSNHPLILFDTPINLGYIFTPAVIILGTLILFIAANAGLIGSSRLTFSMGSHFQLPRGLYRIHPRFRTPYVALIFITIVACFIVFLGRNITVLADLYNFGAMLSFALAHLSLIALRIKEPDRTRPFKVRGNIKFMNKEIPVSSVIGFLATFAVWIIILITHHYGRNVGLLWMFSGIGLYVWFRYIQKLPMIEAVDIEEIRLPQFKRMKFNHILVPTRGSVLVEMLQTACKIAKEDGSKITAIHVIEIPENMPLDTFLPNEYVTSKRALEHAQAIGREYGINIETMVVQSRFAGEAILDFANELNVDLIVLGASKRPRYENVLFGTTVDYIIRNAKCRVWASFASSDLPR